jgi:hypothetical protein
MPSAFQSRHIWAAAILAWGCVATSSASHVGSAGERRITVLLSSESDQKYCNGEQMDTDGYRKTLTRQKELTLPASRASTLDDARAVLDATTTGMCNTAVKPLDFRVERGEVHVPPIDSWAGVSIVMCHCVPEVEVNLLRVPGITRVVWDAPKQDGKEAGGEQALADATKLLRHALGEHDFRAMDWLVSKRIGLFVVYPVGIRAGIQHFNSFSEAFTQGKDGFSHLEHVTLACDLAAPAALQAHAYADRPDPCSDKQASHQCTVGTPQGFSFATYVGLAAQSGPNAVHQDDVERAKLADRYNERFVYDASPPLGVFWGRVDGAWVVLGLDLWDCSI